MKTTYLCALKLRFFYLFTFNFGTVKIEGISLPLGDRELLGRALARKINQTMPWYKKIVVVDMIEISDDMEVFYDCCTSF